MLVNGKPNNKQINKHNSLNFVENLFDKVKVV